MYTYQTKKSEKTQNQETTYSSQHDRNRIPEIVSHPLTEINSSSDVIQCYHGIEEHDWEWRNNASQDFDSDNQYMFEGTIKNPCDVLLAQNNTIRAQSGDKVKYDGTIRDNIKTSVFSKILVEHVYGRIFRNESPLFTGWIPYENITPEYSYAGNDDEIKNRYTRMVLAPRSIRAWMETIGTQGMNNMLQGDRNAVVHQAGRGSVIDLMQQDTDRIDPANELRLKQIDGDSNFYDQFTHFLNENAERMPGTMARDHELRNPNIGGQRAELGREWLNSYGNNRGLNESDYIVITGAENYKIFVNSNAPTWEAYNANTQSLTQHIRRPPSWIPSEDLGNRDDIKALTKDRPGEYFLFHGSSKTNILNIAKTGFDPEYVNYTAIKGYGKTGYGSAFTDQFAKALAYSPPTKYEDEQHNITYKHYVLVARVFVGNSYDAGDRARRTRGNLELTEDNLNYQYSVGNKPKAQGKDKWFLGQSSDTVRQLQDHEAHLHSTFQHRQFSLQINDEAVGQQRLSYRDTSIVISDAIQMYPAYIIECEIPGAKIKTGQRTTG